MSMKKFYVGVKAIVKDERGYLVLKAAKGYHDIPGGRIDGGESFEQTIKRELSEELPGTEVEKVKGFQSAYRVQKDIEEGVGLVLLYFLVEARVPKEVVLSEEHDSFLWVNRVDDLPEDLNPAVYRVLQELLK